MNQQNKLDLLIAKRQENSPLRQAREALMQRHAKRAHLYQSPTGNLVDLVLVVDTTASMDPFLDLVKKKFGDFLQHLCKEDAFQGLRFSVVLYKDHGAEASGYDVVAYPSLASSHHFATKDEIKEVVNFIQKYGICGGGGYAEALGAALYIASNFEWSASQRIVISLGDKPSHGYHTFGGRDSLDRCPYKMSHQQIIDTYRSKAIKIFSVCCGDFTPTKQQYSDLSKATGGAYIEFDELDSIDDIMLFLELSIRTLAQQVSPARYLEDKRQHTMIGVKSHKALLAAFSMGSSSIQPK